MNFKQLATAYIDSPWFSQGLTKNTQRAYKHKVSKLVGTVGDVEVQDITGDKFLSACEGLSNNDCNFLFAVLKAVLKWGATELKITPPDISYKRKHHQAQSAEAMTKQQAKDLIAFADRKGFTPEGNTANAVVCMFLTGMRLSEFINAKREDVLQDKSIVEVTFAKGKEKGRAARAVGLNELSMKRLLWFPVTGEYLLPMITREYGAALKVWERVKGKVPSCRSLSLHSPRHGFALTMLDSGYDVYTISRMLGHQDIKTTERYLQMNPHTVANRFKGIEL